MENQHFGLILVSILGNQDFGLILGSIWGLRERFEVDFGSTGGSWGTLGRTFGSSCGLKGRSEGLLDAPRNGLYALVVVPCSTL